MAQPPLPCSARLASMGWGRQGAGWARAQGAGPLSTVAGPRGGLRRTEARWMASEVKPRGHRTRCLQLLGLTCEEATSAPTEWGCGLLPVPPAPPWDARVPGRGFQGCRAGGLGEQGWRPGSESPALPLRGHPMLLPPRGAAQLWDTPLVCMSGCLGSGWACAGVCRGDGGFLQDTGSPSPNEFCRVDTYAHKEGYFLKIISKSESTPSEAAGMVQRGPCLMRGPRQPSTKAASSRSHGRLRVLHVKGAPSSLTYSSVGL